MPLPTFLPLFLLLRTYHLYSSSQIREARPKLQRRRLRLIHAGRLLADSTHLASWLGTLEERQQQQQQQQRTATKARDESDPSIFANAPPSSAVAPVPAPWLHCSVGAQLSDGEEDGEAQPQVRRWQMLLSPFPFLLFLP